MITLELNGNIVPKARPRFSNRRAYLPARYRRWKEVAIAQLQNQYTGEPIERASISIELHGSLRGDLDNLSGAVLDALVQADVIVDDRLSRFPCLEIQHYPGKQKMARIKIQSMETCAKAKS